MTETALTLPYPSREDTPPVDAVRGFVFSSGRTWMQDRGLFEAFLDNLTPDVRAKAFAITALEWIPLDEAMVCYRACDALQLSTEDQRDLGRHVSTANNGVLIQTMARLAGGLGVTPWVALSSLHKVWLRSNRGGAAAVFKLGPAVARVELWNVPMVESPFFCTSMCGAIEAGLTLFRKTASVTEMREVEVPGGLALRASW